MKIEIFAKKGKGKKYNYFGVLRELRINQHLIVVVDGQTLKLNATGRHGNQQYSMEMMGVKYWVEDAGMKTDFTYKPETQTVRKSQSGLPKRFQNVHKQEASNHPGST